jgi:formylglycine-generating enzyme required for sulfatase activity
MLPERLHWVIEGFEPEGDPWVLLQIARDLEAEGNLHGAAAVIDRAYGLEPGLEKVHDFRAALLDRLAIREHGLVFRYVPGGPFLMGSRDGEPDEQPLHPVWLAPYWLTESPVSWADFCRLLDWEPPPGGTPRGGQYSTWLGWENQVRGLFCEDEDVPPGQQPRTRLQRWGTGGPFALRYDTKPMVALGWQTAQELAQKLTTAAVRYGLPTEAQWEKAARGGLIGARHAWGDEPPSPENCDFNRFHAFDIHPSKTFPPNGYGLYAMNGGVWEWTADWYDSEYYRQAPSHEPAGPERGEEKVLRGGSWADCAEAMTVSFRMSRDSFHWSAERVRVHPAPNMGFRLCRVVVGQRWP